MAQTDYAALGESQKERLVLRIAPVVKEALKTRASELGLSPSAYVTMLVTNDEGRGVRSN